MLAAGSWGLAAVGGGLGIPGLLTGLSRGEGGSWPGRGGRPEDMWPWDKESGITGLRWEAALFTGLCLLCWLVITSWWLLFPPVFKGEGVTPFRTILFSNWLQMDTTAGV